MLIRSDSDPDPTPSFTFWKKWSITLHLIEKWIRIRIRQNDANATGSGSTTFIIHVVAADVSSYIMFPFLPPILSGRILSQSATTLVPHPGASVELQLSLSVLQMKTAIAILPSYRYSSSACHAIIVCVLWNSPNLINHNIAMYEFPEINYLCPVFRIHDILVWIRIQIRGSMPLTNGSGSWIRILLFSSLTIKMPAKN